MAFTVYCSQMPPIDKSSMTIWSIAGIFQVSMEQASPLQLLWLWFLLFMLNYNNPNRALSIRPVAPQMQWEP